MARDSFSCPESRCKSMPGAAIAAIVAVTGEVGPGVGGPVENTYSIKWDGTTKETNYTVSENLGTLQITRRPVVVTANDAGKIYGDQDPELTATPGAAEGNENSGLVGNETVEFTVSRETGENAGSYVITASGAENQGNYVLTIVPGIFTIVNSGDNVITGVNLADADGTTKMYDGTASTITATAAVPGSTFEYSLDGTSWTSEAPPSPMPVLIRYGCVPTLLTTTPLLQCVPRLPSLRLL